jgi:hypothetical protein
MTASTSRARQNFRRAQNFSAKFSACAQKFGCGFVIAADPTERAVRESIRKKMPFWPSRRVRTQKKSI